MSRTHALLIAATTCLMVTASARAAVIAHWTFDEFNHGDTVGNVGRIEDTGGADRDGWSLGSTAIVEVTNLYGTSRAMSLDGDADGLSFRAPMSHATFGSPDITAGQAIDWDSDWTAEIVVNTTSEASGALMGYNAGNVTAGEPEWWARMGANGIVTLVLQDTNGVTTSIVATVAINDGQWHHVAVTHDATNDQIELFIDGVSNANGSIATLTGSLLSNEDDFIRVGSMHSPSSHEFIGLVDQVRISSGVLTAQDFIQPIPEPASVVLMGVGAMLLLRRRH